LASWSLLKDSKSTRFKSDFVLVFGSISSKKLVPEQVGVGSTNVSSLAFQENTITRGGKEMLSRDCDGCSQMKACGKRYLIVEKGNCVYCPDGTAHLVDGE
jgi:hypothetical protein